MQVLKQIQHLYFFHLTYSKTKEFFQDIFLLIKKIKFLIIILVNKSCGITLV